MFTKLWFTFPALLALVVTACGGTLVPAGATWRYHRGTVAPSPADPAQWRQPAFSDGIWLTGALPIGYDTTDPITFGTRLADMQGSYRTVFLRRHFTVLNPANLANPALRVLCDDGVVVWLNGVELGRTNAPAGEPLHTSAAAISASEPIAWHTFAVPKSAFVTGDNVLAAVALNVDASSSDFYLDVELTADVVETEPPVVSAVTPPPGEVSALAEVTVTFSEPVSGVDASDFQVNGTPADSVTGTGDRYTFRFAQPPFGQVTITWAPFHGLRDEAATPNEFNPLTPGNSWSYTLVDATAPLVSARLPAAGDTVRQLAQTELHFSEPVTGVEATDLLVNGQPALSVTGVEAGPYVFTFPAQPAGTVQLAWAANHGITDVNPSAQPLNATGWSVTVNPAATLPDVRINEFVAANANGLRDEDGDNSAWLELLNRGATPVDLTGYALTDDPDVPDQWLFPAVTLAPGQHLLVFASGKDRRNPAAAALHTNFKLSRTGEPLLLFNRESPRAVVSGFTNDYPAQRNDLAYGYASDGTLAYLSPPTPGTPNGPATLRGVCEPVHFSVERGFFPAGTAFELVLTCPTPGATIRYTTNGSEPALTNSLVYTAPIPVTRTVPVRAAAFKDGTLASETRTHTYLFPTTVGQRNIPAISLVTATNHLTGRSGIVGMQGGTRDGSGLWQRRTTNDFYNPINRGIAWERPVSVEFIEPDNGGFQEDAGLRLQASDYFRPRLLPTSKFSWRLYFRGDYGAGKLRFPLIAGNPVEEYDVLVLRAGSNDRNPFVKDELARRLFADCGQVSSLGSFASVWLNGRIMPEGGYYNLTERIEADFLQAHHGGSDQWDVMSQSGPVDGTRANFDQLLAYANSRSLTVRANYEGLARWLDLTNFVDYLLVNIYGHVGDWPHNNWRAARERRTGALWRFYIWDAEFGFGTYDRPVSGNTLTGELAGGTEIPQLYQRLRASPEFRLLFADRIQKHFFDGGALVDARIRARFDELVAEIRPLLSSPDRFIATTWIPQRRRNIFSHFNAAGLLAGSNAPALRQAGGPVPEGFALTMTNRGGDIWFTTDGSDPRIPFTGTVAPAAQKYDPGAPPRLTNGITVKARSFYTNSWSALTEAAFQVNQLGLPLRITELMFNPPGGEAYEFIELRNLAPRPLDLSGVSLRGVEFVFPAGTMMPALATWVLASDLNPTLWSQRYPGVAVAGYFDGALSNGGERVALVDADGATIQSVEYDDEAGWPEEADGGGYSLEPLRPDLDPDAPGTWFPSAEAGGNPGSYRDDRTLRPLVQLAEIYAGHSDTPGGAGEAADFVEVLNQQVDSVALAGWTLERTGDTNRFSFPAGTLLPAGQRLVVWCGDGSPVGALRAPFGLPREGAIVILRKPDGSRADVVTYGPQVPEFSQSRSEAGTLELSTATPNAPNAVVETASVTNLVFNEWLANARPGEDDFIELFNRDPNAAVSLRGLWLNASNVWFPLNGDLFVPPGGHLRLKADEQPGPDHLDFKLTAAGMTVRLLDAGGAELDRFNYVNAVEGVSRGRLPDGGASIADFPRSPSPGAANYLPAVNGLRLVEVAAHQSTGDWVEVENPGLAGVTLTGWTLRVRGANSGNWPLPANLALSPGGRILLGSLGAELPANGVRVVRFADFALPDDGGELALLDPDDQVADQLVYGFQLAGQTLGLNGGRWDLLSQPTPGADNAAPAALAEPAQLSLNEWRAGSTNGTDWIELFNPAALPLPLGGLRLTDDPSFAGINRHVFPPLSFLPPQQWRVLTADGDAEAGPDHLGFRLSALGETLRLYGASSNHLGSVTVLPQLGELTAGRLPDGGAFIAPLSLATPGSANRSGFDSDGDEMKDEWEVRFGLLPNDPADAALDSDSDGLANRDEFRTNTDPRDPASGLRLAAARLADGTVRLRFTAEPGVSYSVVAGDGFDDLGGLRLRHVEPGASRAEIELLDQPGQMRVYRIVSPALPH